VRNDPRALVRIARVLAGVLLRPPAESRAYRDALAMSRPCLPRGISVTWLGAAGVLVGDGDASFLIDPFVSRHGLARVATGRPLAPRIAEVDRWVDRVGARGASAVLVSHSHYDHALDAPFFAVATGGVLAGSESTANVGRGAGLPAGRIRVVGPGDALAVGRFRLTFIESRHGTGLLGRAMYPGRIEAPLAPPAPASAYREGTTFAIRIEHPAGTIVHHGSAGFREGMYAGASADAVLLGLAGATDVEAYLASVVDALGAKCVVPIHFDDFFARLDGPVRVLAGVDLAGFLETVRRTRPSVATAVLPLGQVVEGEGRVARAGM
jgi:L-ascorbate metabolism protein UlaG (beta-lactamase superfamily)